MQFTQGQTVALFGGFHFGFETENIYECDKFVRKIRLFHGGSPGGQVLEP